ncbi:TENA/THI-4/PQQC family protein [Nitzschia inconspicua]|uniref:TENA/THI-4/PQQC family protein n=1 Tax=Nitzschia inconspicua TaxID=303405 RepID=A0A9K3PB05_9STRA|nr:TENA/THI-4/PQQC family protein [Nitzschia inconspicua]
MSLSTQQQEKKDNYDEQCFPKCCVDFWKSCEKLITETSQHAFLTRMVDGSLPQSNFQYYVVQDALYLQDFGDCLRRLSKSAGNRSDAKRLEQFAIGAEEAELALHRSFFQQWNISATGVEQMPNCLLYTSYMKRIVTTRPHAQGLAVLLPCFWVYQHVGQCMLELRSKLADSVKRPPQYDAWIDMYGGDDFAREVKEYMAMVDAECQLILLNEEPDSAKEQLQEMQRHFFMSCKLEHMFWDQALHQMEWPTIGGM